MWGGGGSVREKRAQSGKRAYVGLNQGHEGDAPLEGSSRRAGFPGTTVGWGRADEVHAVATHALSRQSPPAPKKDVDKYGGIGAATIVDSLDTLWLLGLKNEFKVCMRECMCVCV